MNTSTTHFHIEKYFTRLFTKTMDSNKDSYSNNTLLIINRQYFEF